MQMKEIQGCCKGGCNIDTVSAILGHPYFTHAFCNACYTYMCIGHGLYPIRYIIENTRLLLYCASSAPCTATHPMHVHAPSHFYAASHAMYT